MHPWQHHLVSFTYYLTYLLTYVGLLGSNEYLSSINPDTLVYVSGRPPSYKLKIDNNGGFPDPDFVFLEKHFPTTRKFSTMLKFSCPFAPPKEDHNEIWGPIF